jgi:hypothetical protein
VPATGRADWRGDEAHIKRLERQLAELKAAVALFERHRRALELVEAEIANVQLGLADPRGKPVRLVRKVLARTFPKIKLKMRRTPSRSPRGIGIWRWRCELAGAVEEIRWATQLLRQKGLFILPSPREPVRLVLEDDQRRGTLSFIGHHIRLKYKTPKLLPWTHSRGDALANRTDHLARKIRRLRREITVLRSKVADIQGFEARLKAIKQYLSHLRRLTNKSIDPFQAITPLLDLELIQFDSIVHRGALVLIRGSTPSPSTRVAVDQWLKSYPDKKTSYRIDRMPLQYAEATKEAIQLPTTARRGRGPRYLIHAARARPVDLGALSSVDGPTVVVGKNRAEISGRIVQAPLRDLVAGMAKALDLALVRDGTSSLIVSRKRGDSAASALRASRHLKGRKRKRRRLRLSSPLGATLSLLRRFIAFKAPGTAIEATEPTFLIGRASPQRWIRLVGAGAGLRLDRVEGDLVLRTGSAGRHRPVIVPKGGRIRETTGMQRPLCLVRIRMLSLSRRKSFAVVSADSGPPILVRRGTVLGRNRSQVVRIGPEGLTLLWSGGRITKRILLPFGRRLDSSLATRRDGVETPRHSR